MSLSSLNLNFTFSALELAMLCYLTPWTCVEAKFIGRKCRRLHPLRVWCTRRRPVPVVFIIPVTSCRQKRILRAWKRTMLVSSPSSPLPLTSVFALAFSESAVRERSTFPVLEQGHNNTSISHSDPSAQPFLLASSKMDARLQSPPNSEGTKSPVLHPTNFTST